MPDPNHKLRVGIVSANWGAIAHLPAWRALGDAVEVTAICTSRQETAEAAAAQFGLARPFWDYTAMCADPNIDIIDTGTNPLLREKIVTAALEGGKHVANEMPFAASGAAADRLAALQRDKGLVGLAAVSVVGLPHLALMKEMIDEGYLGDVYQVQCHWQLSIFLQIFPGFTYTWFGKSGQGVSVLRNQGSHMLHALRHLFGPIDAVVGRAETQLKTWDLPEGGTMDVETDDTAHAMLRFRSGAMGMMSTSWTAADAPGFFIEALGSKGRLRLEALRYPSIDSARLYAARPNMLMAPDGADVAVPDRLKTVGGALVGPDPMDLYNGGQRVSFARLFEDMVDAIRSGGEPVPGFTRAAEVQSIIEAIYRSNESRAWEATTA